MEVRITVFVQELIRIVVLIYNKMIQCRAIGETIKTVLRHPFEPYITQSQLRTVVRIRVRRNVQGVPNLACQWRERRLRSPSPHRHDIDYSSQPRKRPLDQRLSESFVQELLVFGIIENQSFQIIFEFDDYLLNFVKETSR